MNGLHCVVLVLLLILIWQCCCKKENFGTAPPVYTPQIQTAAWMTKSPWLGFEDAQTAARTGTLLHRLGMDNAGGTPAADNPSRENYTSNYIRTNASGSFDQVRGY